MRLSVVDHGHDERGASVLAWIREQRGGEPPGVLKTLHYRPELFGRPWRTAPVGEALCATLGFIETMTLRPGELGPADVRAVRAAGVDDGALVDAIYVCALFNVIVRLADALGWDVPSDEAFRGRADAMLAGGYALLEGPPRA